MGIFFCHTLHYILRQGLSLNFPAKQTSELRDPSVSASQLCGYTYAKPHPGVYLRARDPNSGTDACIANTLQSHLPARAASARFTFLLTLASCIDVLGLLLAGTRLSPKSTWRAGKQMRSWQGCSKSLLRQELLCHLNRNRGGGDGAGGF